jgi:hypothetical protein
MTYYVYMACVFCDKTPVTKEHVFPQWLNRYLPPGRQEFEQARYGTGGFDIVRSGIGLDFTVRKVCALCNNGWMAQLEARIIDILHPLITGLEIQLLSLTDQRQIAVWAAKTAMMLDNTQAAPILPDGQLARMRTHRAIPTGTRIWMGACQELYPLVAGLTIKIDYEHIENPGILQSGGFFTPLKIGHLCLYVYFTPQVAVMQLPSPYRAALARIWPRRGSALPWPPPSRPESGQEFEVFADNLWRDLALFDPDKGEFGIKDF